MDYGTTKTSSIITESRELRCTQKNAALCACLASDALYIGLHGGCTVVAFTCAAADSDTVDIMCGIWAIFGYGKEVEIQCACCLRIAHRGPDSFRFESIQQASNNSSSSFFCYSNVGVVFISIVFPLAPPSL